MELWHYDFIKSFISNFVMVFSLSRHRGKHWLTRLLCGGDKSLLIISYANFLSVFWQFSDDSKYLSSCHKEMPMSFKFLMLQLGLICSTAADKLRFILTFSLLTSVQSNFFFLIAFISESGNVLTSIKNIHFSSSFTEKYSVTPSW